MKNETKQTPGPWHIGRCASDKAVYGPLGEHVATLPPMLPNTELIANVRLIAAAPELLAACELALQLIRATCPEEHGNPDVSKVWGALETAILKAKGGEA